MVGIGAKVKETMFPSKRSDMGAATSERERSRLRQRKVRRKNKRGADRTERSGTSISLWEARRRRMPPGGAWEKRQEVIAAESDRQMMKRKHGAIKKI